MSRVRGLVVALVLALPFLFFPSCDSSSSDGGAGGDNRSFPEFAGFAHLWPATFSMGESGVADPVHSVTLDYPFWIGKKEVTQAEYEALMDSNPSNFQGDPARPVEQVTWFDARAYCAALMKQQVALGAVPAGYEYRLPTEAEWEYACRAGTDTSYNVGATLDCAAANIDPCVGSTRAVGSYASNAFGLHDMHGNVWEWCLDSFAAYTGAAATDPFVTGSLERVLRGGSWHEVAALNRSATRLGNDPGGVYFDVGFRVVLGPVRDPGCPQIAAVTPAVGAPFGGNTITIAGTRLAAVNEVRFGDQLATNLVAVDDQTLTATVPASQPTNSPGVRSVTVRSSTGGSTLPNGYRYVLLGTGVQPTIASVSPQTVNASGGETVTITGANFTGALSVAINQTTTSFTVVNDATITAIAPAHAPGGLVGVSVETPAGVYTAVGVLAYWQAPSWPCTVLEAAPDPAVVYDPALRTAILRTGLPWRITESALGIEMLLIPNGTFWMGCSASLDYGCGDDESPNHWVTLTKPFYLGRYEVTQAQWQARTGSNPSHFRPPNYPDEPTRPVELVSWNNIVNVFQPGTGLRLPTEAEWEYACRAGTTTAFHGYAAMPGGFDDDSLLGNIAWYDANAGSTTHPVGQKAANGFGLHDMAGNVSEWCADRFGDHYYSDSPASDPPGPSSGSNRVLRDGAWINDSDYLRASERDGVSSGFASHTVGFRVARTP